MAGLIDPTVTGNYPVILGDGLLGKTSNEIFTGIRYNHKPAISTSDARLKPSVPGKTASYDLAFSDTDGNYAFSGTRATDNDDYVLYFDPERKAFILDKVDSTFNMNLTHTPGNSDAGDLRRRHPHLASRPSLPAEDKKSVAANKEKPKPAPKVTATQNKDFKRKVEKKQQPKKFELALPVPEAPKPEQPKPEQPKPKQPKPEQPKPKQPKPEQLKPEQPKPPQRKREEEEEEDDDDGDLLIEYPGAETTAKQTDFSPAFPAPRRFDDFMDQRESEADDADGESDDEPDMDFKLPSPVNNHGHTAQASEHDHIEVDEREAERKSAADLEDELEKEMENAFEELRNSQDGSPGGDESEISEED